MSVCAKGVSRGVHNIAFSVSPDRFRAFDLFFFSSEGQNFLMMSDYYKLLSRDIEHHCKPSSGDIKNVYKPLLRDVKERYKPLLSDVKNVTNRC